MKNKSIDILVLDDEIRILDIFANAIDKGDRVFTYQNPTEAINHLVKRGYPDLYFVDINMPSINGNEFTEMVYLHDTYGYKVCITGSSLGSVSSELYDEVLLKPFTISKVKNIVEKVKYNKKNLELVSQE